MFSFSLTTAAVVFGVVFLAELPDKTALAGVLLGTRFRAAHVLAGMAAAFLVHVVVAVAAGSALALLPQRLVAGVVAVLFLGGAVLVLREVLGEDDEESAKGDAAGGGASFWRAAVSGFTLILVAELGDITQIMTANLAARYEDPLSVAVGALLALWTVAALGVLGGRALLRWVPLRVVGVVAATVMVALGGFSLYEALAG